MNLQMNLQIKVLGYLTKFERKSSNIYDPPKNHKSKGTKWNLTYIDMSYTNIRGTADRKLRSNIASTTQKLSNVRHIIMKRLSELVPTFIRDDMVS